MGNQRLRGPAQGPALIGTAAVAAAAAVLRASQPILSGTDPFWHWDMGRRILEGGLISDDPYSFLTTGQPWMLNQWGTEALIGVVRAVGGPWSVAVFTALLVGGAMLLVGGVMWRRSPSLLTLGLFGLVVAAGVTNWSLRGNLLTFVLLPLLLRELHREEGARPWVVLLLVAVWANVHAAFLLGVGLIILHEVGRLLVAGHDRAARRLRRPMLTVLAACLGGALTPYGPGFIAGALELSRRGAGGAAITEWAATPVTRPLLLPYTVLLVIVLVALGIAARREDLPHVLVAVAGALFGISALRNVAAGAIVVGVVGAPYVRAAYVLLRDRPTSDVSTPPNRIDRTLAGVVVLVGVAMAVVVVPRTNLLDAHVQGIPLALIRAVDALDREARVVTVSRWAPAVAALTRDGVRTSVDGRLELFTDAQIAQLRQVDSADPGWEQILDDWCATDAILPEDNALGQTLEAEASGWTLARTGPVDDNTVSSSATWWVRHDVEPSCRAAVSE